MVNTEGLDKRDVLAALYNASRPQGMGFLHYTPEPWGRPEAEEALAQDTYFDYVQGRVMKVDLSDDNGFDEWGYDRDNGKGAAQRAIDVLRAGLGETALEIRQAHKDGLLAAASETRRLLDVETEVSGNSVRMGLADVKDKLAEKIEEAVESTASIHPQ